MQNLREQYHETLTDRATRAAKNALLWMHKATEAMKAGEPVYFSLATAAQYAHEFELAQARANESGLELDTGEIYTKASAKMTQELTDAIDD